jgi:hypothetical protein
MVEKNSLNYLSVHYFKTCRVRHWVSQETFLDPKFLVLKVYATVANIGLEFVPSMYPSIDAFEGIPLPASFIGGRAAGFDGILKFLHGMVDVDSQVVSSSIEERQALSVLAENVLGDAVQYALWGHKECYKKFTLPIMTDSMSRPYADVYCSEQRTQYMHKDLQLLDSKLKSLMKFLSSKILVSKFFFPSSSDAPSACDITMYAYLSVLLSIPDKFCPFSFAKNPDDDMKEITHRLKSFLLDFDDYLWHLNSQRAEQLDTSGPLVSAALAAVTAEMSAETEAGESTPIEEIRRPFLGTTERKQNLLFLSLAVSAIAAVMYLNRSKP